MFITLKATDEKDVKKFLDSFENKSEIYLNQPYINHSFIINGNKLIIYKNLTITIEGDYLNNEIKEKLLNFIMDPNIYVGSDEVGIGESIGPIIVCGLTFKNLEQKQYYFLNGVLDSKKLTYEKIKLLGAQLEKDTIYKCITITPKSFNENYASKKINLKLVNAVLHNRIHLELRKNNDRSSIIDEFVNKTKYQEYIESAKEKMSPEKIIFVPKAESKYLEVAGASIIAKYKFNNWIENALGSAGTSINKYLKTSINYRQIESDINKNIIALKRDDIIKIWKK